MTKYSNTFTFIEAFKIMKEKGSYARCCGYPYIFCIREEDNYRIYASKDEGDSFGCLADFKMWMELCKDPLWIISDDGLSWYNKKEERIDTY